MSRRYFVLALLALWPAAGSPQSGVLLSGVQVNRPTDDPDAPVAAVTASSSNCWAPCPVHFDARATTDPNEPNREFYLLELTYFWDFGDSGAGTWTYGVPGMSRNTDVGFVAGHVYETPGTYNWTLTVTDRTGKTDTETGQVQVTSQDDAFPGSQTVCIAANSTPVQGVGGCPSGASVINATSKFGSADFDAALLDDTGCDVDGTTQARRCLFNRGAAENWTQSVQVTRSTSAETVVDAYGSGDKPDVSISGITSYGLAATVTQRGVFRNLRITGTGSAGEGVHPQLVTQIAGNMLWAHIDALEMDSPFTQRMGNAVYDPDDPSSLPRYSTWYETTTYGTRDSGGTYEGRPEGDYMLVLGNRWGDKRGDEHVIRTGWTRAGVIAHNSLGNIVGDLAGCGTIRHILKLYDAPIGDGVTLLHNTEMVITGNIFSACDANSLQVTIGALDQTSNSNPMAVTNWLLTRNWFINSFNTTGQKFVQVNSGPGMASNNVFDLSNPTGSSGTTRGIAMEDRAPAPQFFPTDVRVWNNTFYKDTVAGNAAVAITFDETADDGSVKNNLTFDPGADITVLSDSAPSGPTLCSGGAITPCNVEVASTPFTVASPGQTNITDYTPSCPGAACDVGELLPSSNIDPAATVNKPAAADADLDAGAWQTE